MASRSRRKTRAGRTSRGGADLEELRPQRFLIRNMQVRPLLKNEGTISGAMFELTSWRRDGLLARLRTSGFTVRTLEDQIQALPHMPPAEPVGGASRRPVQRIERYSHFDASALAWVPDEPHAESGQCEVRLHAGWVIRRRYGRGAATYHRVFRERHGGAGLVPLTETEALLAGYAQATQVRQPALTVRHQGEHYYLPALELPPPHREVLDRLGQQVEDGWQVAERAWPLARQVYERLGLKLVVQRQQAEGDSKPRRHGAHGGLV